jgi:hypothetical protein
VVKLAQYTKVKHVVLTHHDPLRTDEALDGIVEKTKDGLRADHSTVMVSAAAEGETIEVKSSDALPSRSSRQGFSASSVGNEINSSLVNDMRSRVRRPANRVYHFRAAGPKTPSTAGCSTSARIP